ncbi:nuclear transport factor 2 family protein [Marinoscillum furvescens]|uniref:SnoaL-like protein n=1 Tax=Marinoscillum furvescens DSM 4134 TaxID=1122208 RepID=A0A3D9LJR1_MARFU|nr:nuclear transport factor 2 family protein [Marinoscillum furvescens]REE05492.1 SnoaL-like protein [Marinoscillum furvescens DSM 4134]
MKLNLTPDCGNAPKKELIKNLTIHFASYDLKKAMPYLADQVTWTLVGEAPIVGKQNFREALEAMSGNKASELTIHTIITHGKEAAVKGEMLMQDGSSFGFADFYVFTSAKGQLVKSIVSYVIAKGNSI